MEILPFPVSGMMRLFLDPAWRAEQFKTARQYMRLTEPETIVAIPEIGSIDVAQYDDGWAAVHYSDDGATALYLGPLPSRAEAVRFALQHALIFLDAQGALNGGRA